MRPHLLELEAFGAFPGEVRLDLDEIGQSGLVLLCGDTGGGKTTLLDALGFALYGVVPGERHKARDDLRSHHAPATATARVRLEFSARGRRLRVTRTPAQTRPKRRGDGVVIENPTALLESWDGRAWRPLAQRPEDVGLEIGRLLGMDAAQFFQVVILPQGRFAAFLQADHKEREKLLKQLFHVHRFEHVERWLADRATSAVETVAAASTELRLAGARLSQEAGVPLPEDLEAAAGWAAALAEGAGQARAAAAADATRWQRARGDAERALADAEQTASRQQARRTAETELALLQEQSAEVTALRAVRDAAERARPVQVAFDGHALVLEALADRDRTAEGALSTLDLLLVTTARAGAAPAAGEASLRGFAAQLHTEVGRLGSLTEVVHRAEEVEQIASSSALAADRLLVELATVQQSLAGVPVAREAADGQARAALEAERLLPSARLERDQATAQLALRDQATGLDAARDGLAAQVAEAGSVAAQARRAATDIRNQRVDAIIAELAATLVDEAPCPVCGATVHPDVAELQADHLSKDVERAAEQRATDAETAHRALDLELAALGERRTGVRARLTAPPPAFDLLAARVDVLETAASAGFLVAAQLASLQAETEHWAGEVARLETREHELRKRGVEAHSDAAVLRARLLAELGEGVELAARRRDLSTLADAASAAAEALAGAEAARVTSVASSATVASLVKAAGFGTEQEARSAGRDPRWLVTTTERLDAHRELLAGVQARLVELDVALEPPAPVQECRTVALAAVAAHEQAHGQERVLAGRATALTALVAPYCLAVAAMAPLRREAAEIKGLADVAAGRGTNRLSMPLSTYVLAARLEEVAESASARLSRMSDGRYTLTHTDTGRDRRSRAGLGLQVEDGWTGRRRDTATLSGGETFMTALALALGLADVVTAEAGGRSIDALFVDEGFGSLDAASLDQVMDVLDELRSGGRLVGVVSHVADLKLRIPAQVKVVKGERGSRVEIR